MTASSQTIQIEKIRAGSAKVVADQVATEEPLEIRLGYATATGRTTKSVSITMRTPGDDIELALGFLFSESIIKDMHAVASVEHSGPPAPGSGNRNIVRVDLEAGVAVDLGLLQRHFYTTSSCGVCGKSSLDALYATGAASLRDVRTRFSRAAILGMPDALRQRQETFSRTGGLHAAAAFDSQGEIVVVHEDVGRHNAVDKVIGKLLVAGRLPGHDLGLIVSGRASFELMQKTMVAGIPLLAAVSAPSSLAVQLAEEFDVSLIGFLRGDAFNIYSGGDRIE